MSWRLVEDKNVTCLVKFTFHSGGFTSPGKPSEISSASLLLCQSRAQVAEWKVD